MKNNHFLSGVAVVCLIVSGCVSTTQSTPNVEPVKPDFNKAYQDYLQLGAHYVSLGRYDLAEPKLKRAIEIDSEPPEAWNVLAVLYEEKRDIAAGNQVYQKLIASHPDYPLGFMNYATFLCKFDRDADRQNLYDKMRRKGREFVPLSYIAAGDCERKRQQDAAAQAQYRQALVFDNKAAGALLPLSELAVAQHDYATALGYLKVMHTYIGYSPESVRLAILAARGTNDRVLEEEMMRIMRGNYGDTPQAKSLGI